MEQNKKVEVTPENSINPKTGKPYRTHRESAPDPKTVRNDNNRGVKHVIAVMSGKGGVGKSLVTSMLAAQARRNGFKTAILDADITGPSIPKSFGITGKAMPSADGQSIIPCESQNGIKIMSMNLLMKDTDPVVWRGPIIASAVTEFWEKTTWGDTDYMFIDCPPGTGDVPLTIFQSLPVDGIVVVTSPQDLVSMIVEKAVKMAAMMNIPILGIVENMSYYVCPDCGKQHSIFGESHVDEAAEKHGIDAVAKLPINPQNASLVDAGRAEALDGEGLKEITEVIFG